MGLNVNVFRDSLGDCTNGGVSSKVDRLCVVNIDGTAVPSPDCSPVILESHGRGIVRLVPAVPAELPDVVRLGVDYYKNGAWARDGRWLMFGGNYAATSDSRFTEAAERLLGHRWYGAVAIHDRYESAPEEAS